MTLTCTECESPRVAHTLYCEQHREAHRAAWKAEHTRGPQDYRAGWLIGDPCYVRIGTITYEATITDMSDVSRREHNHDLVQLELEKTVTGLDGKPFTQKWIHPKPVPSYKLRKRVVEDL